MRTLLCDDHVLVRAGIRALIEEIPGAAIVAEADNGRDALALARAHSPDLVVMDISMKELNGIEATAQLLAQRPGTRVLILSMHTGEEFVRRALRAGAAGYLVKDSAPAELRLAIEAIARGETYISSRLLPTVISDFVANPGRCAGGLEALTSRQREILQLIAEGRNTKQIAFGLDLSVKTVESHRTAIMERLGIRDVAGLVVFAARHRLIEIDVPGSE